MTDSKLPQVPEPDGRRYTKPELRKYGRLTQITSAVGNMGLDDAGVPPTHKTGV